MDSARLTPHATGAAVDFSHSMEEDSLVDGPAISTDALHSAIRREFQTIPTYCYGCLLSLLHVVFVVLSVCVSVWCVMEDSLDQCAKIFGVLGASSAILFGKVCLWVLVLCFTGCMHHHHRRARNRGYLQFYREMQRIMQLPLTVHSAGNALLLVLLGAGLSQMVRTYLLLSILGVEFLVAFPCLIYYIVKVIRFNKARAAPDVSQEENTHTYSITSSPTETGFREGSNLEEVVEKQADLIEYLKQHNTLLSKRLLDVTAQQSPA